MVIYVVVAYRLRHESLYWHYISFYDYIPYTIYRIACLARESAASRLVSYYMVLGTCPAVPPISRGCPMLYSNTQYLVSIAYNKAQYLVHKLLGTTYSTYISTLYTISRILYYNHYISYLSFRPLLHLALFISPATSRMGLDEPYYISYLYYISCLAFRPPTISCALTISRALCILTTTSRYSCFCACYNSTAICALTLLSPYLSGFKHPPCIYTCE